MAKTFHDTDGDIRAVMKTMFTSKEFFSQGAYQREGEDAVRDDRERGARHRRRGRLRVAAGQPDRAARASRCTASWSRPAIPTPNAEWINSAALLARMNFALDLTQNKVPGVKVDPGAVQRRSRATSRGRCCSPIRRRRRARPSTKRIADQKAKNPKAAPSPALVADWCSARRIFKDGRSYRSCLRRRVFLKSSALAMVGVGATPVWLSRALYAADAPSPRKKVLVAIFQRGAVDGLNVVVPHGEKRYYELRPDHRDSAPERHARMRRSIWMAFRTAPVARAAEADLRRGPAGDRARGRLARPDAFAFRRAGLHGIRHAGPQGDHRRLAESGAAAARSGKISPVRAVSLGAGAAARLRGHNDAVAINNLNEFQVQDARELDGLSRACTRTSHDKVLNGTGRETFEAVKLMQSIQKQPYIPRTARSIRTDGWASP